MEPHDDPTQPPAPPRHIPPLPPPPELLKPTVPHVPLTPMMDFFQRRLEAMERELALERERARAAEGRLQQKESLSGEVESQLRSMAEQLKREKLEREGEEQKSHARGRIDSLEKRLDEMHQSFVALLRDAISKRDSTTEAAAATQETLRREQGALTQGQSELRDGVKILQEVVRDLADKVSLWRVESQGMAALLPELRALSAAIPTEERRFEGQLAQMLAEFQAEQRERAAAWERRQELEREKGDQRLQAFVNEKASLERAWEERNHELRREIALDRARREGEVGDALKGMTARVAELLEAQAGLAQESEKVRSQLTRAVTVFTENPKAKDAVIAAFELEKQELMKALRERADAMQKYIAERREVERTLGESLSRMHLELDEERAKQEALRAREPQLELEAARLKDELASARRAAEDQAERSRQLSAERDSLAKALMAEAERVRLQIEERTAAGAHWEARFQELQKKAQDELESRARQETSLAEVHARAATLSEHLARALRDKEAVESRFANWEQERQRLAALLKDKDEMISMLNATFQGLLKK